jgi:general secretion pathway protein K
MSMRAANGERGVALLAVLWLSVALTMIAMTTSYLVRAEAGAVANNVAAERAAFLAQGGIEAALFAMLRAGSASDAALSGGVGQSFQPGQRRLRYEFREGVCEVEVVPENAKIAVNLAPADQLAALFTGLGIAPEGSRELAEAIVDWRAPRASSVASTFDLFYAELNDPYEASHAPFDELDELLGVKGMTRDLFFGQIIEGADGARRRTPPLADLLTTDANFGGVNVNYAAFEVLRVLPGWNDSLAAHVIEARSRAPFQTLEELRSAAPEAAALLGVAPVTLSPSPVYTLTATAQVHDSEVRRSVRARIRFDRSAPMGVRMTAWWHDWPWSHEAAGLTGGAL